MPTVGAHLGLTFKLRQDSNYEFMRPDISIDGVDVDGDIDMQLEMSKVALRRTFGLIEDMTKELILQHKPDVEAEMQLQISNRLKEMKNAIEVLDKKIKKLEKK